VQGRHQKNKEFVARSTLFHDLRHHAITELSEGQASDQTIMSIAGHISPRMLRLYSHVRMQAKRTALDALSARPSTNEGDSQSVMAQSATQNRPRKPLNSCKSLKRLVDVTGIEPATPCLQSRLGENTKCFVWCRLHGKLAKFPLLSCTEVVPKWPVRSRPRCAVLPRFYQWPLLTR